MRQQRDRDVGPVDDGLAVLEQLGNGDRRLTSDDVLSIEMVSLPVGGMMTRIACGSTMRA